MNVDFHIPVALTLFIAFMVVITDRQLCTNKKYRSHILMPNQLLLSLTRHSQGVCILLLMCSLAEH